MIMFTIYSGLIFLIGLLSFVCSIPVTTTEVPIDESGGKYANFIESEGPILGQGGFGRVIKMINPTNEHDVVAAKCIQLGKRDSIQSIREERDKHLLINKAGNHNWEHHRDVYERIHGVLIIGHHPNVLYDSSLKQKYLDKIRRMPDNTQWPFTPRTVFTYCKMLTQLLAGLEYLHNINIIHRDVHKGNIMISSDTDTQLVLIDFGVSTFDNGQPDRKILNRVLRHYTSGELDAAVKTAGSFGVLHKPKDDIIAALIIVGEFTTGIVPERELCQQIKRSYENKHAASQEEHYKAFRHGLGELCEIKKTPAYVEQAIETLKQFPDQYEKIAQLIGAIVHLDREDKANLHKSLKEKVQNVIDIDWGSNMKMDFIPDSGATDFSKISTEPSTSSGKEPGAKRKHESSASSSSKGAKAAHASHKHNEHSKSSKKKRKSGKSDVIVYLR